MTIGSKIDAGIGKTKELGQKVVDKIKSGGTKAKSAGVKAKNFVGKNKAALIAAGALGAAGLAGGYAMGKNRGKSED